MACILTDLFSFCFSLQCMGADDEFVTHLFKNRKLNKEKKLRKNNMKTA